MAKCAICSISKGKRYCAPLDKLICPACCGKSRMNTITCNPDCRYLAGYNLQKKRREEREFNELIYNVPHGEFDDIFQDPVVAGFAYELESIVRNIYVNGEMRLTDTMVFEAYKKIYKILYQNESFKKEELNVLESELYKFCTEELTTEEGTVSEKAEKAHILAPLLLRLMLSIRRMSGGLMGEYGYLNYLKNNLSRDSIADEDEFVVEDKFGKKTVRNIKDDISY